MKIIYLFLILLFSSCSTIDRSKTLGSTVGALLCGTLGVYAGKDLSPNKDSENVNKLTWGSVGALTCGFIGRKLAKRMYKNDARNFEGPKIIIKENAPVATKQETLNNDFNIDLSDLSFDESGHIDNSLIKGLPKELARNIEKQRIIKYKIKPQIITTKQGKKLYFNGGEAIEHRYIKHNKEKN